jgi:hypothetical protein
MQQDRSRKRERGIQKKYFHTFAPSIPQEYSKYSRRKIEKTSEEQRVYSISENRMHWRCWMGYQWESFTRVPPIENQGGVTAIPKVGWRGKRGFDFIVWVWNFLLIYSTSRYMPVLGNNEIEPTCSLPNH